MLIEKVGEMAQIATGICGGRMDANARKGGRSALPPLQSAANVARKDRGSLLKLRLEYVLGEWARMSEKEGGRLFPRCIRPLNLLEKVGGNGPN